MSLSLGIIVKYHLQRCDQTHSWLAGQVGVTKQHIGGIIAGRSDASRGLRVEIARVFELDDEDKLALMTASVGGAA